MKWVGAHVSIAGGVGNAPLNAQAIGARAFGLFTRNQRQWNAKPLTDEEVATFQHRLAAGGFTPRQVLPHDSYLINLGHPDAEARGKSLAAFIEELRRCRQLGLPLLNFHPGSHLRLITEAECLALVADSLNRALEAVEGVTPVIENTAGQGSNVGYTFQQIGDLIGQVAQPERIGVCLDTCHAFAAGYDLRTEAGYQETMAVFDRQVGFAHLQGMHLNDAKSGLGSRVDRHHSLTMGHLGLTPFRCIMNDPRLEELPLVLETIDQTRWPAEITLLYGLTAAA